MDLEVSICLFMFIMFMLLLGLRGRFVFDVFGFWLRSHGAMMDWLMWKNSSNFGGLRCEVPTLSEVSDNLLGIVLSSMASALLKSVSSILIHRHN